MSTRALIRNSLLTLTLGCATMAVQAATPEQLLPFQQRWAEIQYDLGDDDARAKAFSRLAEQLEAERTGSPKDPDLMIWQGITLSSEAGARGGLGALKLVKQARSLFEQAIDQDPEALQGSAMTSLATLYHQVPGWPIGFGDDDKASQLFKLALKINPDGIDSNYFYAVYLADKGDKLKARERLMQALKAPARPGRERADAGRRNEVQALLQQLNQGDVDAHTGGGR